MRMIRVFTLPSRLLTRWSVGIVIVLTVMGFNVFAQPTPTSIAPEVTEMPVPLASPTWTLTPTPPPIPSPVVPDITYMPSPQSYSPTVPPIFPTTSNPAVIGLGEEINGEISADHSTLFFNYEGQAGEIAIFQLISPWPMPNFFFDVNYGPEYPLEPLPTDDEGNLILTSVNVLSETRTYTVRLDSADPSGPPHPFTLRRLVPETRLLALGETQQGNLGLSHPLSIFTFDAEVSAYLSLTTQALYPTRMDVMFLSDRQHESRGVVGAGTTPGYGYGMASIDFFQIPYSGRYAVVVRQALNVGGDPETINAPFQLTLREVETTEIAYGESIEGELTEENSVRFYSFRGRYGDVVTASVDTDGRPDTMLTLYGPDRWELMSDDDSNGGLDPEFYGVLLLHEWTDVGNDNTHFFLRVRATQIEDYGPFTLTLENTSLELSETPVVWRWNNKRLINTYHIEGKAGEKLSLKLRVLRGALTPNLDVTQAREQLLHLTTSTLEEVEAIFTVPQDGRVLVTLDSGGRFLESEISVTRVER